MFTRSAARMLASILAVFIALCILWADAASASEAPYAAQERALHAYVDSCSRRPLANGRPGETVVICEHVRPWSAVARPSKAHHVARSARRTGTTTVVHYGHRAPEYTITYLVAR
jgi:hypothetical protein